MSNNALQKIIEVQPAWDRRSDDPSKNYGIHGAEMRFILKGEQGAVQFVIYTNWHLPHVAKEFGRKSNAELFLAPMGADVGYHSPVPHYGGQTVIQDECPYLDGKPCYYDGSSLAAEKMLALLIAEGSEAMWAGLRSRYDDLFPEKAAVENA